MGIYEKMNWGRNPISWLCGCGWPSYGDWGFYLTLLYFSMVVPYAYLGFKTTNKSKGIFATSNGIIFNFEKKFPYRRTTSIMSTTSTTSTGVQRVQEYHEYRSTTSTTLGAKLTPVPNCPPSLRTSSF